MADANTAIDLLTKYIDNDIKSICVKYNLDVNSPRVNPAMQFAFWAIVIDVVRAIYRANIRNPVTRLTMGVALIELVEIKNMRPPGDVPSGELIRLLMEAICELENRVESGLGSFNKKERENIRRIGASLLQDYNNIQELILLNYIEVLSIPTGERLWYELTSGKRKYESEIASRISDGRTTVLK